ncbi:YolD-like family protein [Staphylococcus arlettae]|uniref:YolD-like family protein n=1 Tax=Staphylococcus arlettae TaxID=29378 RepID=UPI000DCE7C13|nr:YolD-like family protein [Staphylococcus arlettae]RBA02386.1 YolD-like protein [Staphylococcus arlettae]
MKIINPDLPEPYKYETDYRKIPREYLNPRIPKGRGSVKWQPFKSLPIQYEILDQYIDDQNKIDMPLLSQEQLESINDIINVKIETNSFCTISYWDNGYIKHLSGIIKKVDTINEIIYLTNDVQKEHIIKFSIICDIE